MGLFSDAYFFVHTCKWKMLEIHVSSSAAGTLEFERGRAEFASTKNHPKCLQPQAAGPPYRYYFARRVRLSARAFLLLSAFLFLFSFTNFLCILTIADETVSQFPFDPIMSTTIFFGLTLPLSVWNKISHVLL